MMRFVGLDVSQKTTAVCVVDKDRARFWRGQSFSTPEQIEAVIRQHIDGDARLGIETGPMTAWLVHELRSRGLDVVCLDARHAGPALKMQLNKTDANDAEGLAQIMRTGWFRAVHVKSSRRAGLAHSWASAYLFAMTNGLFTGSVIDVDGGGLL